MAYSFSGWNTFIHCPFKFRLRYIDKLQQHKPTPPAVQRGLDIHKSIEDFLNHEREDLHPEINEFYGQYFFSLREDEVHPEMKFAFDWDWEECGWKDEKCMVRGVLDTAHIYHGINILEYKTGRMYDDHIAQRTLYGVAGHLLFPGQGDVTVTTVYLDQKKNVAHKPRPQDIEDSMRRWKENFEKIEAMDANDMVPNPHWGCKYCEFSKHNGGPCAF